MAIEDGWLTEARKVRSPNHDERPLGSDIELIVVHGISLPPGEFGGDWVEQLFTNRLSDSTHPYFRTIAGIRVSAHLYIRRDGSVIQFVSFQERAWHAGVSQWMGRADCNDFSVGIELEGCDMVQYANAQYDALNRAITDLRASYPKIGPDAVVGHCDIAPGRKSDPGLAFDWCRVACKMAG